MATQEQIRALTETDLVLALRDCSFYYGALRAVAKVSLPVYKNRITALIGPSGCGKSTVLRGINRMLELTPGARVDGEIIYRGQNLYAESVDPVEVRRRIGMVFQEPNPFPKSIFDNVAYGPRLLGVKKKSVLDEIVERSLRDASLWDEVSGDLNKSGFGAIRRATAAALHRARDRGRARCHPDGRALFRARPDRDPAHRRTDAGTAKRLHHRHRDA